MPRNTTRAPERARKLNLNALLHVRAFYASYRVAGCENRNEYVSADKLKLEPFDRSVRKFDLILVI
jgi:hypothetical protein